MKPHIVSPTNGLVEDIVRGWGQGVELRPWQAEVIRLAFWGSRALDRKPGEVIVAGARFGEGKTWLARRIADDDATFGRTEMLDDELEHVPRPLANIEIAPAAGAEVHLDGRPLGVRIVAGLADVVAALATVPGFPLAALSATTTSDKFLERVRGWAERDFCGEGEGS